MTSKFDKLLEGYAKLLMEQDPSMGAPASQGAPEPPPVGPEGGETGGAQPPPQPASKAVSQGYAHNVELIYNLFKAKPSEAIKQKYLNLSDNKALNSKQAYEYLRILENLLPKNTITNINKANFGKSEGQSIDLDDAKMVEMANIAIKALFFTPKDNLEFSSKLDDIENILAQTGNRVTVENANTIYTEIKNLVGMEQ